VVLLAVLVDLGAAVCTTLPPGLVGEVLDILTLPGFALFMIIYLEKIVLLKQPGIQRRVAEN